MAYDVCDRRFAGVARRIHPLWSNRVAGMGAPAGITQRERHQCMARHGQCYQETLALICVPDHPYDCFQLVIPWYTGSPAHLPAGAVETWSQRNIYHYHHRQYWRYYWRHFVRLLLTE